MPTRTLQRVIEAIPTSDGAGVKLQRSLGQSNWARLDPFLMLDHFSTENPDDYVAGFPAHPHRGFETVTYMLDGHMRHQDHLGNTGDLKAGGVQWMSAGRGIIHSEMPQQEAGRMRGFQLWITLPAKEKMKAADYRDIQSNEIPVVELAGGGRVKVIAGTLDGDGSARPARSRDCRPIRCISTSSFPPVRNSATCCPPAITPSSTRSRDRSPWARKVRRKSSRHTMPGFCRMATRSSSPADPMAAGSSCSPAVRCSSRSCSTDRS